MTIVPHAMSDHGNHSVGLKTRLLVVRGGGAEKSPPLFCVRSGSSTTPATNTALSIKRHSIPTITKTIPTAQKKALQSVAGLIMREILCESWKGTRECFLGLHRLPIGISCENQKRPKNIESTGCNGPLKRSSVSETASLF